MSKYTRILLDFKTYLFLGVISTGLAPMSELLYWGKRSIFFAKYAFFFYALATIKVFIDELVIQHPRSKSVAKSMCLFLWKKLKRFLP